MYTSFSVGAYCEQATAIGKMFIAGFLDVCAPRQQMSPKPAAFMAVWDEFANFMFEGILKPLTTIRSAEISMLLCHQNRSQLSMLSEIGEAAQYTVEGNTKTKIIYFITLISQDRHY
ncbi:MAG: TraM recognition domain-containing protein [Nitrospinae bacterium]|nr:TraM recognition domain-containing protein [Nitrospinota bacterium]